MKYQEIREMTDTALVHKVLDLEHELVTARFALSLNRLDNTAKLSVYRKDIARLHTEIGKREKANNQPKDSMMAAHRSSWQSGAAEIAPSGKGQFLAGLVDKIEAAE